MVAQGPIKNWYNKSTQDIATELGANLRQMRLNQNLTQEQLSDETGLSRSAISEMENGKVATSLFTIIQVLRGLHQFHLLEYWQIAGQVNPLQIGKLPGKERVRATRTKRNQKKDESDWEWL